MLKGFLYAPVKLTPEQIHHVEEKFSESLQDQVQLVPQTDKSLIGGIRVEIDGRVYDGTIKKRLTIKDDSGDIDFASDADNFEWLEGLNTVATVEDERDEAGQIVLDSDGKPKKKRKSKLSSVDMEELEKRVRRMSGSAPAPRCCRWATCSPSATASRTGFGPERLPKQRTAAL